MSTLHTHIIDWACKKHGWHRGNWRKALAEKCKENPYWQSALEVDAEIFETISRHPDAWRIVTEGPKTPGVKWNYDVLVLEFLEVEISHPMPLDKRQDYVDWWWQFDGTDFFHFRVYRVERYGEIKLYLDTDTVYDEGAIVRDRN